MTRARQQPQRRPWYKMKRVWVLLFIALCIIALNACTPTRVLMQTARDTPKARIASPTIAAKTLSAWEAQKAKIRAQLATQIYGPIPALGDISVTNRRVIDSGALDGRAVLEEITITAAPDFGSGPGAPADFVMVLLSPKGHAPRPVIMMETYCPNHATIPMAGVSKPDSDYFDCGSDGLMAGVFGYFFGRYIATPPLSDIIDRGYAIASVYSASFVPDNARAALPLLRARYNDARAIGMWAYQFGAMTEVLKADARFNVAAAYGHSRYGKAALVAAAFYPDIDAAIAHQSGTGGASLTRNKSGETAADITDGYPHWFAASYTEEALSIDQHHLLALIAPRPILLGNARRDVWSDPEGAFIATRAASPVYELYGKNGLHAQMLGDFRPPDNIAFWIRPGTHGVVKEDWPAFLDFMDAHF